MVFPQSFDTSWEDEGLVESTLLLLKPVPGHDSDGTIQNAVWEMA